MSQFLVDFSPRFKSEIITATAQYAFDPAHDLLHIERVVENATRIARAEKARMEIVVPAAWFHDVVIVPKNDPRRSQASRLSADEALKILARLGYPAEFYSEIAHAIETHSFSANITPQTLEAKAVQDADRLDGLGAIGIARCFATAGLLKRVFYSESDPFCESRSPEDAKYTIDHFYQKLFKTAASLQTETGRKMGEQRVLAMRDYLLQLNREILGS